MRRTLIALVIAAAALLPGIATAAGRNFGLFSYWEGGKAEQWFSFGARSPLNGSVVSSAPVWVLITGLDAKGNPVRVPNQDSIFDVKPGDPGYSDLWQMVLVQVPQGYEANSIRSLAEIQTAGLKQTVTSTFVNCPFVSSDDTLGKALQSPKKGWVRDEQVWYFDFGPTSPTPGRMWRFTTGTDKNGAIVPLPGQFTVSDATPGAFKQVFWVQAPNSYVPNSITTAQGVEQSGFPISDSHTIANVPVPVVSLAEAPARPPDNARYGIIAVFSLAVLGASVHLLRLPTPQPASASEPPK